MTASISPHRPCRVNEHYADLAKALHDLAERVAILAASPAAAHLPKPGVQMHIMPATTTPAPDSAAHIAAVAAAVLGLPTRASRYSDGRPYHTASADVGPIWLSVHGGVPADTPAAVRAAEALYCFGAAS